MTLPVILRRPARAEFDAAGDWYERQRPGVGLAFTTAVQRALDRIAAQPQLHRVVFRDIRRAVVSGFPYCVYYRERPSAIVVIAVFHTARDPSIWQSRS
jgi:plasmid stabilization system protein ParE